MSDTEKGKCTHAVPRGNPFGLYALHSRQNRPVSMETQDRILADRVAAAQERLRDAIRKASD